jgi:hypothetical protein
MPLVRFLAYYQILEYYFPIYSRSKAITTLREKLKEIFGRVKDSDVADVVDAMRVNRRAMLGGEKDQLAHTIEHCVDPVELRSFLEDTEERTRFYGSDEALKISTINIPIGGSSYDPRSEVALRVYEIRNRIVHTKSQHDDLDPLLPFDPEVALLKHDIRLMHFLARSVLTASARPLQDLTDESVSSN